MLRRNKENDKSGAAKASKDAPENPKNDLSDPDAPLKNPAARLGEILLEEGLLDSEQLEEGLAKRQDEGGFLGQKLIDLGYLDQETLTQLLVKQCKIPHINLLDYQIEPDMAKLIPEELSLKYRILPIDRMGHILTIAMVDPLNAEALVAVREAFPDLRIKPILCDWPHFEIVFKRIHSASSNEDGAAENDDPLSGLALPPKRPKKKAVKSAGAETAGAGQGQSSSGNLNISTEDLTEAIGASMSQLLPTLMQELRQGLASENGGGGAPAVSAVEKKLESLAHSVSQIAQASEVFQAARRAEEKTVTETLRKDLEAGSAETSAAAGDADALGAEADLATGSPLGGYSFDSFIAGENNAVTLEIGKAVAESPGTVHNPLFLCGDVGLGKTHMINAIGNDVVGQSKELRVGYTSATRFAAHVKSSLEQQMIRAFRVAYNQWDVLILDDIQFLAGHVEAQEELFHIFNTLHQDGKQIIIAGDKAPQKLGLLEERLVSRFEGGMVVHLMPPEWDTRILILRSQAKSVKASVPDEVLAMLAMKHPKDVRRLLGCLHRVISCAQLKGYNVTCELASNVLSEDGIGEAA